MATYEQTAAYYANQRTAKLRELLDFRTAQLIRQFRLANEAYL